jgi:hypothetical protein
VFFDHAHGHAQRIADACAIAEIELLIHQQRARARQQIAEHRRHQ